MHGCGRLGVAEFTDQCADGDRFLSIDIGDADFGFCSQSHDVGPGFRHGVNGSIDPEACFGRLCRIR